MSYNKPIRRIAIVGTGVIGASCAAEYLARGFQPGHPMRRLRAGQANPNGFRSENDSVYI